MSNLRPCDDCRMSRDCPHADSDDVATCMMQGEHPAVALLREYRPGNDMAWWAKAQGYLHRVDALGAD